MASDSSKSRKLKKSKFKLATAEDYLRERKIPQLFESLAVGLSQHKPQNEVQYLLHCLDTVTYVGWQNVNLQTFINKQHCEEETSGKYTKECDLSTSGMGNNSEVLQTSSIDVTYDTNQELKWFSIICGSLNNLPEMPSNVVRVFISSTFSDFKAERNVLLRDSFPVLQQYCAELGLDFQVVDLRWGVTDEVINDHQVSAVCLSEIASCQRVSVGPNFVTMIGDRYGFRPFPSSIAKSEFEVLVAAVKGDEDVAVLKEWYQLDENAVPAYYGLRPIGSKLPYYYSKEEEFVKQREEDRAKWEAVSQTLQSVLRRAVGKAVANGLMDQSEAQRYFISVTEDEIIHGIFKADPTKTLCCFRSLVNLDSGSNKCAMGKFTDLTPALAIDDVSRSMLNQLKTKLIDHMGRDNVLRYETQWNDVPLEAELEAHKDYLRQFSLDFVDRMKSMVRAGLMSRKFVPSNGAVQALELEVLHHSRLAVAKAQVFYGRKTALSRMQQYMGKVNNDVRHPLVLHGVSGQGKTAVMAVAAARTVDWFAPDTKPIVVLRFLGTTPASSDIFSVLKSVIAQISTAFNFSVTESLTQMGDVRRTFWSILERIGTDYRDSTLVIYLDSVDQLSRKYGGHLMAWLPRHLPGNVFLVVSVLTEDVNDCLKNIKTMLDKNVCLLELDPLSTESTSGVIRLYLENAGRKLTDRQTELIDKVVQRNRQPLFLKVTLDRAMNWSSFTEVDENTLADTIHMAILRYLETLDHKYGEVFVSHSLSYLSCALGGISALEMEDALSCDDAVLNDVYRYHDPPLEGSIRIPSLMWARVHEELREYLVDRQVEGKSVISWYHRQFWEAADRYLKDSDRLQFFHRQLADIYQQEHGIRRTIELRHRRKVIEDADRKVTPQPLCATNIRKLRCLPYHLFQAGAVDDLKERCLVNFRWLSTCLAAFDTSDVVREHKMMCLSSLLADDAEIELVSDLLQLCYDPLRFDIRLFAYHVVERLSTNLVGDSVRRMVGDAAAFMSQSKEPRMLPTHSMMFDNVNSPLRWTIMAGQNGVLSRDGTKVACAWIATNSTELQMKILDLLSLDILATVKMAKPSPVAFTHDSRYFAYITETAVRLCEVDTGELHCELTHCDQSQCQVAPRCVVTSHHGRYLAIGTRVTGHKGSDVFHTYSQLTVYDMTTLTTAVGSVKIPGKKAVISLVFDEADQKLTAFCANNLYVYEVPGLSLLHHFKSQHATFSSILKPIGSSVIAIGITVRGGAKVALFDTDNFSFRWSSMMSADGSGTDEKPLIPFGISVKQFPEVLMLGTRTEETKTKQSSGQLWLWTTSSDSLTQMTVAGCTFWQYPTALFPLPEERYVLLGWSNGDVSVFSLESRVSVWNTHAHGRAVNTTVACGLRNESLLTLAADNYVKKWCVKRLMSAIAAGELSRSQRQIATDGQSRRTDEVSEFERSGQQAAHESDREVSDQRSILSVSGSSEVVGSDRSEGHNTDEYSSDDDTNNNDINCDENELKSMSGVKRTTFKKAATLISKMVLLDSGAKTRTLNPEEQCVDATVIDSHLVTATPNNRHAPKFWNLGSGVLDEELSENFNRVYNESLTARGITFGFRHHAQVVLVNNYLIYILKKSNAVTYCVSQIVNRTTSILAHAHFPDSYLTLAVQQATDDVQIFLVRNGALEVHNVRLELLDTIEMPSLAEEIPGLMSGLSSTNKKKLLNYKVAVTDDKRFFVIVNPTAVGKSGRYMDVIDLERKLYVGRTSLAAALPWNVIDDGVYYLVQSNSPDSLRAESESARQSAAAYRLMGVRKLSSAVGNGTQPSDCRRWLLRSGNQMSSPDGSCGVELTPDHVIHVWRSLNSVPVLAFSLVGHRAEVTCVSWSARGDLLVSGSHDCCVRLWSLTSGSPLCLFHLYGSVDNIRISGHATNQFVAVHYSYAPYRKRAIILKIANVDATDAVSDE